MKMYSVQNKQENVGVLTALEKNNVAQDHRNSLPVQNWVSA